MNKVIIRATELDGHLTQSDKKILEQMDVHYQKALLLFAEYERAEGSDIPKVESQLIELYNTMGHVMRDITSKESSIRVYSFETPRAVHGEASRLISKLRDLKTRQHEFVYYIQRAYELLFTLSVTDGDPAKKNYIITKTPVDFPVQNYAVHKIPDVDAAIENSVMCVMLRGALLPSMIMSKEMQEYSSRGFVTPFALFKISRDDSKYENNMEYTLNLDNSFFDLDSLNGKDLVFADPMNATGGSLVTIVQYLMEQGVKPKSIKFFNAISALKGALRIIRALPNATVYTLWMDPVLNDKAYILPGLGDAGDRINGSDRDDTPRNIIQLIADYGSNVSALYRSQVQKIGETVLGT